MSFHLCMESTSYVFPFGMEFFLPCDHGLLHFEHQLIHEFNQSINQCDQKNKGRCLLFEVGSDVQPAKIYYHARAIVRLLGSHVSLTGRFVTISLNFDGIWREKHTPLSATRGTARMHGNHFFKVPRNES